MCIFRTVRVCICLFVPIYLCMGAHMYVCVCSIARVNKWVAPPQPKVMSACREPCKATTLLIQDAHDEEEDCDEVTIIAAMMMKSRYFSSNSPVSKSY